MADTAAAKVATPAASTAPANGTVPAKRTRVPRAIPTTVLVWTKEEHDALSSALQKTLGDLKMDVSLAPFVKACALKYISSTMGINVASAPATPAK